jgi:hypothetical protein
VPLNFPGNHSDKKYRICPNLVEGMSQKIGFLIYKK